MFKGIDISHYQTNVNWEKLKNEGFTFVIIKAGEGQNIVDSKFHEHYQNAKKYGFNVGIYWFARATTAEQAILEAKKCLQTIALYELDYPVWYDIENKSSLMVANAITKAFCGEMENAGYYTGVYSSTSMLRQYFDKDVRYKYDLWVADWRSSCGYSEPHGMWQYTTNNETLDYDYSYKNYPEIIKNMKKTNLKTAGKQTIELIINGESVFRKEI